MDRRSFIRSASVLGAALPFLASVGGCGLTEPRVNGGMRLVISRDGRSFTPVLQHDPELGHEVGEQKLVRDPSLAQDPDTGLHHLVWTNAWSGVTIGHASSSDMLAWSASNSIPVMQSIMGARNCWGPELIYDHTMRRFVILWVSTISKTSFAASHDSLKATDHRVYATTTRDFSTFSPTRVLYNPGFKVSNATMVRSGGKLYMFVLEEDSDSTMKQLRWCEAVTPLGPFGPLSKRAPITCVEGVTEFAIGGTKVAFDHHMDRRSVSGASPIMPC